MKQANHRPHKDQAYYTKTYHVLRMVRVTSTPVVTRSPISSCRHTGDKLFRLKRMDSGPTTILVTGGKQVVLQALTSISTTFSEYNEMIAAISLAWRLAPAATSSHQASWSSKIGAAARQPGQRVKTIYLCDNNNRFVQYVHGSLHCVL